MTRAARTHRSPPPYRRTKNRFAFVSKSGVLPMKAVRVSQPVSRKMSEIVFRDDLYPRIKTSAETVQKYAEDLSVLPAIEVNQHNELIDGWHRWTAHKKANTDVISVIVTPTSGDADVLEMAIERNAAHGLQFSQEDKRHMARQIYASTALAKQGERKKRLAHILSVDISTIQKWLSRIDKDNKEKRDCAVRDLYTRCYTQDEIAELVGMPQGTIKDILVENGGFRFPLNSGDLYEIDNEEDRWNALEQRNRANAEHRSDFEIPIYNVWK